MKNEEQEAVIRREFAALGFGVIYWNDIPNSNGVDCYVQKGHRRPLSVEIKTLKKNKKTLAISVEPIGKDRQGDDLIAIIINEEFVLIEPMSHHLKCCGPKGHRSMSMLK